MWYLLLVVAETAGALALAWNLDSKVAETAATALAVLGPTYLAWKAFRHDRAEAAAVGLGTTADQLAVAVRKQWDEEAAIRRLNDPYPLPVAWQAADTDLVEPWPLLGDMARAWPGGPPGDPAQWPADSAGLAGADTQIGDVFTKRVPTRRLVVLGEPNWLSGQLRQSYPGLRATAPDEQGDLAQALLDAGLILPLLDGFDELPPVLHDMGFNALNRELPAKAPLILASRAAAYRDTVTRPEAMVRLNGAAGIHLLPLTHQEARSPPRTL